MTAEPTDERITLENAHALVRVSQGLGRFAAEVGKLGTLFFIPLVFVTMWDVFSRKIGWIQIWLIDHFGWVFESTLLQELEWHFHTALFATVLGYGYVYNRHVRVDLVRERLSLRKQAWIEFLGCSLFMLPYCFVVTYYAFSFVYESYQLHEISASLVGLSHRWIIKAVLLFGIIIAGLAGIAVWLQTVLVLFGPRDLRFDMMTLDTQEEIDARRIKVDTKAADEDEEEAPVPQRAQG